MLEILRMRMRFSLEYQVSSTLNSYTFHSFKIIKYEQKECVPHNEYHMCDMLSHSMLCHTIPFDCSSSRSSSFGFCVCCLDGFFFHHKLIHKHCVPLIRMGPYITGATQIQLQANQSFKMIMILKI